MDLETQVKNIKIRKNNLYEMGYSLYHFYPFADLFEEIYPEDHPYLVESFSEQPDLSKGDDTITEVHNPYEGKGALIGFGRGCMRFVIDEEGLGEFIDHLVEIKALLKEINDKNTSLHTTDEPLRLSTENIPGFRHDVKRMDDRFEAGELSSGPAEERKVENIRGYIKRNSRKLDVADKTDSKEQ